MNDCELPVTVGVPLYARLVFAMSEDTAYAAARRGDIPTITIGGKLRVPVRVALAKVAGGDAETLRAMTRTLQRSLSEKRLGRWPETTTAPRQAPCLWISTIQDQQSCQYLNPPPLATH
jgi:hypothetical protein